MTQILAASFDVKITLTPEVGEPIRLHALEEAVTAWSAPEGFEEDLPLPPIEATGFVDEEAVQGDGTDEPVEEEQDDSFGGELEYEADPEILELTVGVTTGAIADYRTIVDTPAVDMLVEITYRDINNNPVFVHTFYGTGIAVLSQDGGYRNSNKESPLVVNLQVHFDGAEMFGQPAATTSN